MPHTTWCYCQTCMCQQDHEQRSDGVWICKNCKVPNPFYNMTQAVRDVAEEAIYVDERPSGHVVKKTRR